MGNIRIFRIVILYESYKFKNSKCLQKPWRNEKNGWFFAILSRRYPKTTQWNKRTHLMRRLNLELYGESVRESVVVVRFQSFQLMISSSQSEFTRAIRFAIYYPMIWTSMPIVIRMNVHYPTNTWKDVKNALKIDSVIDARYSWYRRNI